MPELNVCSIEPMVTIPLVLMHPKCATAKGEKMPYRWEGQGSDKTARCAVCNGKFGLVRHYSWRTQLCSRKCVDRFRARRQSYGNWTEGLQIISDELPENGPSAS